jgi:Zn-dependent protease/CBS domain-containing protein
MEQSFRFGRVAGIEVGASWSVLVIAGLLTWALASGLLPAADEGRPDVLYVLVAAVAVVLFFASLLAHEVGHSLVAARHGVEVRSITLWLFGGVARLEHDTTDPATEVRIAATGPVVSMAIGIAFILLSVVANLALGVDLLTAALAWLGWINLLLAVFNLVPAFPLDGGRVLRGILWRRWDDRLRATEAAAQAGVAFGWLLVGGGILALVGGFAVDGLWFALIGWFVIAAARAETAAVAQDELLGGVPVREVMTPDPVVVAGSTTVADVLANELLRHRHVAYPVTTSAGDLLGVLTLRALLATPESHRTERTAGQVAVPLEHVVVCGPDDPASGLVTRLATDPVGRALVVEGGSVLGIVTRADLVRALALRDALAGRPGATLPS